VGIEQLTHPHFEIWHKWFIEKYKPPINKIGVFIPCAAIKPYYNSPIHKGFNKIIDMFQTHKIVISNAGIIPYEFAGCYPFESYDWNPLYETKEIKREYIRITATRLKEYVHKHEKQYCGFVCYLLPSESKSAVMKANINDIYFVNAKYKPLGKKDRDLCLINNYNLNLLYQTLLKKQHAIITS